MEALKNLPIGVQEFESLRRDGYLYVDKTALVYQLATTGRYYFLSRPRRFGKSMLLSTLHAYFEGKKELFEGLAIENLEKDWIKYPVLHLDLNTENYSDPAALENKLRLKLSEWEALYGRNPKETTISSRFEGVIKRASEKTGLGVVILVDEYEKPVLQVVDNEELQDSYRATLKGFYGALKSMDKYIKFAFLTGVTKLSKVSIFSDVNNLKDISFNRNYATVCGITDEEIDTVFPRYVSRLAEEHEMTETEAREELRSRYDGYHFCRKSVGVYNPFSLLNAFDANDFMNYWFETGTPSFLVSMLKQGSYRLEAVTSPGVDISALSSVDLMAKDPVPVLYQSGYLTIKDYDPEFELYTLGIPNKEVEDGFFKFLLPNYASIDKTESATANSSKSASTSHPRPETSTAG
jgi:hypothetical protein